MMMYLNLLARIYKDQMAYASRTLLARALDIAENVPELV